MVDASDRRGLIVRVLFGMAVIWFVAISAPVVLAEEASSDVATTLASQYSLFGLAQADDGDSGGSAAAKHDSYWDKHFALHGYLTTAYADLSPSKAPSLSSGEIILGIPEDGTWDYRIAALQLRYDPHPKHTFLVQLSHRKFGDSPLDQVDNTVDLDWLFYQYRFSDYSSLRLGRFAIPHGIFNEIRDVGVVLPFFRPSYNFYREGGFFSETVDGIGLSHTFNPDGDWSVDADIYYGEYTLLEQGTSQQGATESRKVDAKDVIGIQLWLNTPVSGLRIGAGTQQYTVQAGSTFNTDKAKWKQYFASIDGSFERFVARAEYKRVDFTIDNAGFPDGDAYLDIYYGQVGLHATDKLSLYYQAEFSDAYQNAPIFLRAAQFNEREDQGISLVYAFRPNVVLKGEYHEQKFDVATSIVPVFTPTGVKLGIGFTEFQSEYTIFSLSLSF